MLFYEKHIFVCTNQKEPGKKCCQNAGASEVFQYLRERLKEADMFGPGKYRVSSSGCLGRCQEGPALVVYPEGIWYTYQNQQDIDEIIQTHLIGGGRVQRLLLETLF